MRHSPTSRCRTLIQRRTPFYWQRTKRREGSTPVRPQGRRRHLSSLPIKRISCPQELTIRRALPAAITASCRRRIGAALYHDQRIRADVSERRFSPQPIRARPVVEPRHIALQRLPSESCSGSFGCMRTVIRIRTRVSVLRNLRADRLVILQLLQRTKTPQFRAISNTKRQRAGNPYLVAAQAKVLFY